MKYLPYAGAFAAWLLVSTWNAYYYVKENITLSKSEWECAQYELRLGRPHNHRICVEYSLKESTK